MKRTSSTPPGGTVGTRDLLRLLRPHRRLVSLAMVLVLAASALGLAQPMLAGEVIDRVRTSSPIAGVVTALTLLFVVQTLVDTFGRYLLERTGESIVLGLRRLLVHRLLRLRIPVLSEHRIGDLISRASSDTTALRDTITRSLMEITVGVLTVVGATALMLSIDAVLFLVVIGVFVVAGAGVMAVLDRIRVAGEQAQTAVGTFTADMERGLSAIRAIRVYRAEDRETERIVASAQAAYQAGVHGARLTAAAQPAIQLAASGSFLLVLVIGGVRVSTGDLQLGDLIAVLLYALHLVMPLGNLLEGLATMKRAMGALQRVHDGLNLPAEPPDGPVRPVTPAAADTPMLAFDDVHFSYGDRPALHGVTFTLPPGSRTAIVGPSGAGKSTILSLICRFYDPDSGAVSYRGHPASQLTRAESRQLISLVEQDAPVLHGTLRDNLCLGRRADDTQIASVLHQVNLHALVDRLPAGLDTPVGEHGTLLSGGERQRLAIARALLARPALLLLDEPTSSLDTENESVIVEALNQLPDHTAVLVVAHRLSTVRSADRILVVDDGRIVADGDHDHLERTSPRYRLLLNGHLTDQPAAPQQEVTS
ncbi:ABC transporter ATP-binding protein [Streptomyces sp. HUAS TT7]|uniref:ABC transporter ATP-binding protein n=1 Tax=Streptomyces sp. HUAS TT7 TaxID=3447507 RepID=UPI003F65E3C2